jgi:hypothetical protein
MWRNVLSKMNIYTVTVEMEPLRDVVLTSFEFLNMFLFVGFEVLAAWSRQEASFFGLLLNPVDGGYMFFRNVGCFPTDYKILCPRR